MACKIPPMPSHENLKFHESLSIEGLLKIVRDKMENVSEHRIGNPEYSMSNVLISGLAVFGLKYPSLLQFDKNKDKLRIRHNLRTLYGVRNAPCDSTLREVCDEVKPHELRPAFTEIVKQAHHAQALQEFVYLNGMYLLSMDGTGHFCSGKINCPECCKKVHKNGKTEYYHQMLGAVIVHPDKKQVIPLYPEAITHQDGVNKNDCESNAAKRLLPSIRESMPEMKFIILQDAIGADGPNIKMIKNIGYSYIITVTENDQVSLYEDVQKRYLKGEVTEFEVTGEDGIIRGFRFINGMPLNKSHPDILVNYIDYWEVKNDKQIYNHQWITDIELTRENVWAIMRAGRSRWKVENETFNTLKNLGYNLEHNYGHGKKHLATVFANLMMLAFLIDQMQEHICVLFKEARKKFSSRMALWEEMRGLFRGFYIKCWMDLWLAIIFEWGGGELAPAPQDSS